MRTVLKWDIAVFNSGGLRIGSIPKGNIVFEDVYRLDPFDNQVYVYNLTPEELAALLKNTYNEKKSDMLHISGAKYSLTLDPANPAKALAITVTDYDGKPLAPEVSTTGEFTYKVGISSYVKGRFIPLVKPRDEGRRIKATTAETLLQYLKREPVSPQPQRVFLINN
jgi:5'-nucleotidase